MNQIGVWLSRGPRRRDGAEREGDFSVEKYNPYSRKSCSNLMKT
ncbi:MAG: hypothetical protein UW46_C0011G0013 [Candidatus Yanofskybacteria bacterium GW2011_GWF1_44_227]|nr:MAG: hypothetical protein UT69_C0007G0011 [Candidatus Yanofskybacteria bacterium GW2011_GWE1_40_10]KKT14679.1 MAG: hypothetical protein UV97_C0017G0004 [Candidatus Yanofskybacteria bacterium GW2011_GWF2_43_596]KKT52791.1 MAG: hypothetical protein UW46_C0011G0013 [Candidatus Yanofskybacteria bacterium GW2011_GWF1_44_227]